MSGNPHTVLAVTANTMRHLYYFRLGFFLQRKLAENPLGSNKDLSPGTTCTLSCLHSTLYSLRVQHDLLLLPVTLTLSMKHCSPITSISLPLLPLLHPLRVNCVPSFPCSLAGSPTAPPLSFSDHLHWLCSVQIKVARWWRPPGPQRSRGPHSLICRDLCICSLHFSIYSLVLSETSTAMCLDHVQHTVLGGEMRVQMEQHFLTSE